MNLEEIKKNFREEIERVKDLKQLEVIKAKYLGRQDGLLTQILRSLKDLSIEEKKKIGPLSNSLRIEIESAINDKVSELSDTSSQSDIDLTMPGKKVEIGHVHLLSKVEKEIRDIFASMNFSVVEGPEVESEFYNFDALNIPAGHPAREMWDTFWVKSDSKNLLMRTHTSPMQIRYMEKHNPPFQIIVPGRVFRYEATDASHEINFYQVEGLMVGKNVSLANFKFIIEEFFAKFFGRKIEVRFRPSYFPFVEPGVEIDIKFNGKWLEVGGAGMVHPNVFDAVKYNSKEWRGFAFGMGLERLTMIKYGVPDIRLFYSGDLRFINKSFSKKKSQKVTKEKSKKEKKQDEIFL